MTSDVSTNDVTSDESLYREKERSCFWIWKMKTFDWCSDSVLNAIGLISFCSYLCSPLDRVTRWMILVYWAYLELYLVVAYSVYDSSVLSLLHPLSNYIRFCVTTSDVSFTVSTNNHPGWALYISPGVGYYTRNTWRFSPRFNTTTRDSNLGGLLGESGNSSHCATAPLQRLLVDLCTGFGQVNHASHNNNNNLFLIYRPIQIIVLGRFTMILPNWVIKIIIKINK